MMVWNGPACATAGYDRADARSNRTANDGDAAFDHRIEAQIMVIRRIAQ